MATAKKQTKLHGNSRAAKMRKYYTTHPDAKPAEVAKEFNTSYQVAYTVRVATSLKVTTPHRPTASNNL